MHTHAPPDPSPPQYDSKTRREFGEHTDHTKVTVNIPLTTVGVDFEGAPTPCPRPNPPPSSAAHAAHTVRRRRATGGGTFFPAPCPSTKSKGLLLKPPAGSAILHHGDRKHAGDRLERGERMILVGFFYGNERRGNGLPKAVLPREDPAAKPKPSAAPAVDAPRLMSLDDVLSLPV